MMRHTWIGAAALAVGLTAMVGCGGADGALSSASPTAPSPAASSAAPTLNLAGTWTGSFREPGSSSPIRIRSWTVTQSGANVSGPLVLVVEGDGGQDVTVTGTLAGTVSGAQLTSATFTVAAGAIPDLPTCSIRGTGTLAASAASVSGPLAIVIAPAAAPCVGGNDEGISSTPTTTWTFTLTK